MKAKRLWDSGVVDGLSEPWIAFLSSLLAGVVALWIWRGNLRAQRRDAHRSSIAAAVSAVMAWKEMPYRIARRVDDDASTKKALIDEFHEVQQQLSFHCAWMAIFDKTMGDKFSSLVSATRQRSSDHIEAAWAEGPRDVSQLGAKFDIDIAAEESAFIECARRKLR